MGTKDLLNIVHVAAECAPLAKVGGLGDVILGLSRAEKELGHSVEVILPKYTSVEQDSIKDLKLVHKDIPVPFAGKIYRTRVFQETLTNFQVTLIDVDPSLDFFSRKNVYGYPDDAERFLFFSRAALEYILKKRPETDILHLHDWHTATLALFAKESSFELKARVVLTIHNLSYQGVIPKSTFTKVGLAPEHFGPFLLDEGRPGDVNLLKGGIAFSDAVTTVSPNYVKEILTPLGGKELYPTLYRFKDKLYGILNGIDYDYWDPSKDSSLPFHYSIDSLKKTTEKPPFIDAKANIRQEISRLFGLKFESTPLVVAVSRLTAQKGPQLIKQAIFSTLERGGQFILLGSSPDPENASVFQTLKERLQGCRHVHIELSFNEALSHLVYAAADLILVPSIFEPCGLTQMIGMRYGTLPIVRETGGLLDTIQDGVTGFTFFHPTTEGLHWALDRAFDAYRNKPQLGRAMMESGMRKDLSWKGPAEKYIDLFQKLLHAQKDLVKLQ